MDNAFGKGGVPSKRGERVAADFEGLIAEAETLPVSGWDPTPIAGRWTTGAPPWDYRALVRRQLASAESLLDLGTGGGELLSSLAPLPHPTYATESYPPNLSLARRRLEPLGVRVIAIGTDNRIDLPRGSVELVLCRHEEFDPEQVYRVLAPGGVFVTQQVGAHHYEEINQRWGVEHAPPTNAVGSAQDLATEVSSAGFRVLDQKEARYGDRFLDVGALVWYLRFAPWQVPRFSVSRFREDLHRIHQEIGPAGGFSVTAHCLLVLAQRD